MHCRRDPLDNGVSLYFTDFMVGHEYSNDLHAIGRQIRAMRTLMAHWTSVLGDRLMTLDYEALVADPEPLTRAMVAHVGLEWDDACLRPHEVARTVRTASAWQVRQPVYRRSAGRAQRYERYPGVRCAKRWESRHRADDLLRRCATTNRKKAPLRNGEGLPVIDSGPSGEAFKACSGSVERHAHPDQHEVDIVLAVLRHLPVAGVRGGAATQAVPDADADKRAFGAAVGTRLACR